MLRDVLSPTATAQMDTEFGTFIMDTFAVGGGDTIVLRTPDVPGRDHGVLCRIQSECISHVFFDRSCDCSEQISSSLRRFQEAQSGLLIYLRQEGMGLGAAGKLTKDRRDWRNYFAAVDILKFYGISSVELLSLNKAKYQALSAAGIAVTRYGWHDGRTVLLGDRAERTVEQVSKGEAFRPIETGGKPKIMILGDLNIDRVSILRQNTVGGTAYHAALALKEAGDLEPVVVGMLGRDEHGALVRSALVDKDIYALLGLHETHATGFVEVTPTGDLSVPFQCVWDKRNNANTYDAKYINQAITLSGVGPGDYVFVASYLFVQKFFSVPSINAILRQVAKTKASLVLDLIRKSLSQDVLNDCGVQRFDKNTLRDCLRGVPLHTIVGSMTTFNSLGLTRGEGVPTAQTFGELLHFFGSKWLVCRYVKADEVHQIIGYTNGSSVTIVDDAGVQIAFSAANVRIGLAEEMVANALTAIRRHEQFNGGLAATV